MTCGYSTQRGGCSLKSYKQYHPRPHLFKTLVPLGEIPMSASLVLQNGNFLPSTVGSAAQPVITTFSGGFLSSGQSGFCVTMIGTAWQPSESWARGMFAQINSIWVSCTSGDTSSKQQALRSSRQYQRQNIDKEMRGDGNRGFGVSTAPLCGGSLPSSWFFSFSFFP